MPYYAANQGEENLWKRRALLGHLSSGLGSLALASLLRQDGAAQDTKSQRAPPGSLAAILPVKAKRVIWLCMAGGPSQFESFDFKPKLAEMDGQPMPESLTRGQQLAQLQGEELVCKAPQFPFSKFGETGAEICNLFPQLGSVADHLCILRSMTTDAINHDPAHLFMNTGSQVAGRPSMGAWVTYGLGSEAKDLPGFVVLTSTGPGRSPQPIAARQWGAGFLPGQYQGVQLRGRGEAVHFLSNPPGIDSDGQRADIDAIAKMNRELLGHLEDPEIATRISQYEMAFRMQASLPELTSLSDESVETLSLYGCKPGDGSFASNCLLARRLAERGTRFIQLYHRDWDHHSQLREEFPLRAREVDRGSAALIQDLHRRGMLQETLVVWTGEFGRTPMAQNSKGTLGRDHHNLAMSLWLAGGGTRPGMTLGNTDELGYRAVEDVVTVHDLHATMLHLLGVRHDLLTVRYQGLDLKLTGVEGAQVIQKILA